MIKMPNELAMAVERWLREYEHGVKAAAAAAAAAFGIVQYFNHLEEGRVEQTLELYKRFTNEPLFSSRMNISKNWEMLLPKIDQLVTTDSQQDMTGLHLQWKKLLITTMVKDPQLSAQTDEIFEFFGALQVCVERNICDKKSAEDLLKASAKTFVGNNCPYMAFMRYDRSIADYGGKAERLAENPCKGELFKEPLPAILTDPQPGSQSKK
jgi:hypothetical protein